MGSQKTKTPLNSNKIAAMKPGDKFLVDVGENRGLRVSCGTAGTKSFFYRYTSPVTGKLTQVKIGNFPSTSLAQARVELLELKAKRKAGICPATELKAEKEEEAREKEKQNSSISVKEMIDLYLTQHIEDRMVNGKLKPGARKKKGQSEVRRGLPRLC